ncbi:MAG TPA: hypothetical protein VFX64_05930 [Candidatus Nitrosotalea sp.]|nr:hypothetical protein [Candidatus Nitrosotalea sp.]
MKKKTSLVMLTVLATVASFSISGTDKTQAYAEFDKSGNYVCNPFTRGVETNIYADTVHAINNKMTLYMKTHPNATISEQHDVMVQDQKTWDLYNKSLTCISAIGINPDDIISLNPDVKQAVAVPEFGTAAPILATVAIMTGIIVYRKFF